MIQTLKDVQGFLLKQEKTLRFKDEIDPAYLMTNPGCSDAEIAKLKASLDLPDSYLSVIKLYNFNKITIYLFNLSNFYPSKNIVTDLIEANLGYNAFLENNSVTVGLYQIGSSDTDGIFVASKHSPHFKEGEIIVIEERAIDEQELQFCHCMARNFHDFVIIAANAMEFYYKTKDTHLDANGIYDHASAYKKFCDYVAFLNVEKKYLDNWIYSNFE